MTGAIMEERPAVVGELPADHPHVQSEVEEALPRDARVALELAHERVRIKHGIEGLRRGALAGHGKPALPVESLA
jgi:hypothetical protein